MLRLLQILQVCARPVKEAINSGKIVTNVCCYLCLRVALLLLRGTEGSRHWIKEHLRFHWVTFPFHLKGCVMWSPTLHAWYEFLDWDSYGAMNSADFPSAWVQPQPGDVWIDCGAHVGRYAIHTARFVGADGLVVAIEPHPDNFRVLVHNLALNHICNVIPIRAALWSEATQLKLSTSPEQSFSHRVSDERGTMALPVRSITLDGLMKGLNLPSVNWIKLDVEGAECEVIEGAGCVLDRFHPTLLIEVHGTWDRLHAVLSKIGYRIEGLESTQMDPEKGWILARPSTIR